MLRRRQRWWLGAGAATVVLALAVAAHHRYGPRRTPQGQPPLAMLTRGNLSRFRETFNASTAATRVLALLSPT